MRFERALRLAIRAYQQEAGPKHWDLELRLLKELRGCRSIGRSDLEHVADWKTGGRTRPLVGGNRAEDVRRITRKAFAERDIEKRISLLVEGDERGRLQGVGFPMASSLMMYQDSGHCTVLDTNAWFVLEKIGVLDEEPWTYEAHDYSRYLEQCWKLANRMGLELRDLDRGLWVLGSCRWTAALWSE